MKSSSTTTNSQADSSIPPQWVWHHHVLLSLRERLLRDRDAKREVIIEPLVQDTNDMADCATDEFDHDMAFSLLSQDESALREIDAALQRIQDRTYGVCEETGRDISPARLRAVPWARYDKVVQEGLESQGLVNHTRLAPAADIHGPLVRGEPMAAPSRPRHRSKAERRAAKGR
jgi:RNA polymerase-binding transcription factor DksA